LCVRLCFVPSYAIWTGFTAEQKLSMSYSNKAYVPVSAGVMAKDAYAKR